MHRMTPADPHSLTHFNERIINMEHLLAFLDANRLWLAAFNLVGGIYWFWEARRARSTRRR